MKVVYHFLPDMIKWLKEVIDPRHPSYISYQKEILLTIRIIASCMHISSMRNITDSFNKEKCIKNMKSLYQDSEIEGIPHYDTINDFLLKLSPKELEISRHKMVKHLLRMKYLNTFRFNKKWLIAVDATGVFVFEERHCEHCLTKTYNKVTKEGKTVYFHYVLEAKLIVGDMAIVYAVNLLKILKI